MIIRCFQNPNYYYIIVNLAAKALAQYNIVRSIIATRLPVKRNRSISHKEDNV